MDERKKGMALLHQLGLSSCRKQVATLVNLSEEIIYWRIAGIAGAWSGGGIRLGRAGLVDSIGY